MISRRIQNVQAPVIPIVGRWTAEHPGTISLGQGVVNFPPPAEVFEAVSRSAMNQRSLDRYGPVAGNEWLLQLISEKLSRENGINASDQDAALVCTAGANMGFVNAVLAIADVDDEIILLSPYYFNHHMAIEMVGCRVVVVPTDAENQPDIDAITDAITDRTRAIVTVSPNNPTGAVYSQQDLKTINALCARSGIYHISDEAYEYFLYDGAEHFSAGSISGAAGHTISLFSLSKAYGMAGWRIGYSVVPNHLLDGIKKVQDTNLICPPIVCQVAAAAALGVGSNWSQQPINELGDVRDAALQTLADLGDRCHISMPRGAFYLFTDLQTTKDDMTLVENLIRQFSVAVLPGSAFGISSGCSLRLSYGALDAQSVIQGVGRLRDGLLKLL
ncbi:MAG: pyridoxal phosphate-dependent aminotransferase [Planctomycetales bacterium]|nr:pyridoxal phosphate-dependent aminotransferase [Planctomycetales bacterium]